MDIGPVQGRWETPLGFRCSHQTPSQILSSLWDNCGKRKRGEGEERNERKQKRGKKDVRDVERVKWRKMKK
jgi:hypothetical protein